MAKDRMLRIRLTDELYNMLSFKAEASNKTMSEYIRELINNSEVKSSNKNYGALLGAINKIGNNVNQIAHNLNIANNANKLDEVDYDNILTSLLLIEQNLKSILYEYK